jgi:hypothetical protein
MAIFGGVPLIKFDSMDIDYKTAEQVKSISAALAGITRDALLERYSAIDEADYAFPESNSVTREEDAEYTCENFDIMRQFYERAANAGRAVIFTVDY